ncbi:MAG: ABC transporter permease subunit [Myxococcales bacterium]|nr:ABC transporter permease subunit [Myxococcales bacterium]
MSRWRLVPAAAVVGLSAIVALRSSAPSHLELESAWASPSAAHPLGCGEAGVDLLALVSHATLRGVALAAAVGVVGMLVGAPLGAGAALARGRLERAVARACDLVQSIPTFLLALSVLSAVRAPTRVHLAVVFMLTAWAPFARLALAEGRVLRAASFVEAARALGATRAAVLAKHVLPNTVGVVAVQLGATAAAVVVSEAALAFVGFGVQGGVSLGGVLDQGVASMLRAPHVLLVGAGAVFATSTSLMVAGRALDGHHARR